MGLLKYKLFQNEWNGIDLNSVAQSATTQGVSTKAIYVYEEFYKRLKETRFSLSESWIRQKQNNGALLKAYCDAYAAKYSIKPRILSIGAGTGIVEMQMIKDGYNIELQECQANSFQFLRSNGIQAIKEWTTSDLSVLPECSYDVIYIGIVVYALSDIEYRTLLKHCHRILKDHGSLIITDARFSLKIYCKSFFKRIVGYKSKGIFWGWGRSPKLHRYLASKAGFKLHLNNQYDDFFNQIKPMSIFGFSLNDFKGKDLGLGIEWFEFSKSVSPRKTLSEASPLA